MGDGSKLRRIAIHPAAVWGTSFLEGMSVLLVEIAGVRALAPFFGASLVVWTSQITATLMFLALGYFGGGRLSGHWKGWYLSALFGIAGLWLCLFPFMRNSLLDSTAGSFGIALGSFVSAVLLFGIPLACLGAVSPVLIEHWNRVKPGAGGAAGLILFINTMGGLVGAWLTVLVLIPHVPMRVTMIACGLFLVFLGSIWYFLLVRHGPAAPLIALMVAATLATVSPGPVRALVFGTNRVQVLWSGQTSVGLVQVLDIPAAQSRSLLIDGITQGGVNTAQGYSQYEFSEYLNVFGFGYRPQAKNALVLGMGSGALVRQLDARGVEPTVIEIEPKIVALALHWFGVPPQIKVIYGDGRASLRRMDKKFDLIYLDAFAGESVPWHLVTREAMTQLKEKLEPEGCLIINTVTRSHGSAGLARLEAVVMDVFGEGKVYIETPSDETQDLVNATLVAGNALQWHADKFPGTINPKFWKKIDAMKASIRPAVSSAPVMTDDWSDLDFADAGLRARWRLLVTKTMKAKLLAD